MTNTHVVSALRAKRAEISGYIHDLEKKVRHHRSNLAKIDAAIRLFAPDMDPKGIPIRRRYRKAPHFKKGEMSRLCLDRLRTFDKPVMAGVIADALITIKGLSDDPALRADVVERVLSVLRALRKRGTVAKTGISRDARWMLVGKCSEPNE